ncbi:hypothetical protein HPP92_016254 [Vanilla planifolia]|uniref:RNA helicase n=1 Tax=Vanilla planifolia TaxID=51239 RepID=A0A835UNA5_VANPL|nr:hypothetical protein HPP92_016254 [Vanilla planifolia]
MDDNHESNALKTHLVKKVVCCYGQNSNRYNVIDPRFRHRHGAVAVRAPPVRADAAITSACTFLDAKVFLSSLVVQKAVHVQGRQHPVDILYTYNPEPDYIDATLITIFQIHLDEGPGDILAFLTGQEEIESVDRLVHERLKQLPEGNRNILTIPMYHLFHLSSS